MSATTVFLALLGLVALGALISIAVSLSAISSSLHRAEWREKVRDREHTHP